MPNVVRQLLNNLANGFASYLSAWFRHGVVSVFQNYGSVLTQHKTLVSQDNTLSRHTAQDYDVTMHSCDVTAQYCVVTAQSYLLHSTVLIYRKTILCFATAQYCIIIVSLALAWHGPTRAGFDQARLINECDCVFRCLYRRGRLLTKLYVT